MGSSITFALWRRAAFITAMTLSGCSEPPGGADASADLPCVYCLSSCPSADQSPLRLPDGGISCTRVGASLAPQQGDWPDPAGASAPIVYVGPASGPRSPSGDAPIADIASALSQNPRPATIFVARGSYTLNGALQIDSTLSLRGMGHDQTVLVSSAGQDGVSITALMGRATVVSIEGLGIRATTDLGATAVGIRVTGPNTTVNLRDVEVSRAGEGLRAEASAVICADGLTVRSSTRRGVTLTNESRGFLRNVLVRDGVGEGIVASRSLLMIDTALVADNGRDGVVMAGNIVGAPCAGPMCDPTPECQGFQHERSCVASLGLSAKVTSDGVTHNAIRAERHCRSVSSLANVALINNHVTGLRTERAAPSAEEAADYIARNRLFAAPGPIVHATRMVIAGTQRSAGAPGGYGVLVGPTSSVSFDPDSGITSEQQQGLGSLIVDNAGAGVLATGDITRSDAGFVVGDVPLPEELLWAATLNMTGSLVGSNHGPGAFVQYRAVAERVAYSTFDDNSVVGFGTAHDGTLALGQCDRFIGTRDGVFAATMPGQAPFHFGDGVALPVGLPGGTEPWRAVVHTVFQDSDFSRNSRAAFIVAPNSSSTINPITFETVNPSRGNRGSGNQFGIVASAGAVTGDLSRFVDPPTVPERLRGDTNDYSSSVGGP